MPLTCRGISLQYKNIRGEERVHPAFHSNRVPECNFRTKELSRPWDRDVVGVILGG